MPISLRGIFLRYSSTHKAESVGIKADICLITSVSLTPDKTCKPLLIALLASAYISPCNRELNFTGVSATPSLQ